MYSKEENINNKLYTIYCHKNKINNMCYIGQTCRKYVKTRWNLGKGYWCSTKFYNAIKKYGWDNFENIILEDNIKYQNEANQKEIYYINLYNSIKNGYNTKEGGLNGSNNLGKSIVKINLKGEVVKIYNSIIEAVEELGENYQGTPICNCCKGKSFSAYNYFWCYFQDLSSWDFIKHLKSHKTKKLIYKLNKESREILSIYTSISEAIKKLNISYNIIKKLLTNVYTRNEYDFLLSYNEDYPYNYIKGKNPFISKRGKLYMIDKNKNILKVFDNISQAEKTLRVRNIGRCLKFSNYFTVGGYYWCYEQDYETFKIRKYKFKGNYKSKVVYQFDKNNNLLNIFNSVKEASSQLNISAASISKCALNKRKSAGSYIFKYNF